VFFPATAYELLDGICDRDGKHQSCQQEMARRNPPREHQLVLLSYRIRRNDLAAQAVRTAIPHGAIFVHVLVGSPRSPDSFSFR
jgi:hypothetical protein